MHTLNRDRADALCAVIACGFMGRMTPVPGRPTNDVTDFIREEGPEAEKYEILKRELAKVDIAVDFKQPPDKGETPFIMAKTRKLTRGAQEGLQRDMRTWAQALESAINRTAQGALRGAYLGGYHTIGKTEVLGVSDLFQYAPTYRTEDTVACRRELQAAYEGARAVTNAVAECLSQRHAFVKKYVRFVQEECRPVREPYREGCLFASVHGMTRAIERYSPRRDADTHSVRFELALGRATCKVASCIPCSLLMAAMGQNATATHLGRGDNWNFPKGTEEDIRNTWREYVLQCYALGAEKLAALKNKPLLSGWFSGWGDVEKRVLPEVFLEALTYESSFMTKLGRVLELW